MCVVALDIKRAYLMQLACDLPLTVNTTFVIRLLFILLLSILHFRVL